MNALVSIVIPIYNVENYLNRCLESILKQTYKDIEVILVNDGSTDNSQVICESYAKRDLRIKVYSKLNEGVSVARNFGISKATGDYICFVDADDYISKIYIEVLINNIIQADADISVCSSIRNGELEEKVNCEKLEIWDDRNALKQFLYKKIDVTVWGKLYKASLVKGISFEKIKIGEDQIFLFQAIKKSKKIVYQNVKLYFYFLRNTSAMGSSYDERYWDVVYMAQTLYEEGSSKYPDLVDLFYKKEICTYVTLVITGFKFNTMASLEIRKTVLPKIKKSDFKRIKPFCNTKEIVTYLLVKHFTILAKNLVRFKGKMCSEK